MLYHQRVARNARTLPVFGLGQGGSFQAVLFGKYIQFDQFQDFNNRSITAHRMDLGPGWTQVNGSGIIGIPNGAGSNLLQWSVTDPGAVGNIIVADSGAKDATVVMSGQISATGSALAAIFRFQDSGNLWLARMGGTGSVPGLSIYEEVASVFTQRAYSNFTVSTGVTHTISVTFSGANITATLDGAHSISYNFAATGLTSTKHGIYDDAGIDMTAGDLASFYGVSVP